MTGVAPDAPSPFVGLRPFLEKDGQFFFGRERDVRVVSSNVLMSPLTVLYGASGVGKSSLLQAGVTPFLKRSSQTSVVYFNTWQNDSFLSELSQRCQSLVPPHGDAGSAESRELDGIIGLARGRFLLVLDQFEEYLRYQRGEGLSERFERALARIVNQESLPGHVLIGIREDALWMLDQRLGLRIPNLLGNTLALGALRAQDARHVIEKPLHQWNTLHRASGATAEIDDALVKALLAQVQSRNIATSESTGAARSRGVTGDSPVEIAFLQLVLEELWIHAVPDGAVIHLGLDTLTRIGGAGSERGAANQIVQIYVDDILATRLTEAQRDICSRIFPHLVTPSGSKFAQELQDLVSVADEPEDAVRAVVTALTSDGSGKGLLKPVANRDKYEIAHDVLAQPILDWRLRHTRRREREAEDRRLREEATRKEREQEIINVRAIADVERRRYEEQRRSARRLGWMIVVLLALVVATAAVFVGWSIDRRQLNDVKEAATIALSETSLAQLDTAPVGDRAGGTAADGLGSHDTASPPTGVADGNPAATPNTSPDRRQGNRTDLAALEEQLGEAERQNAGLRALLSTTQENLRKIQTGQPAAVKPAPKVSTEVVLQDYNGVRLTAPGVRLLLAEGSAVRTATPFVTGSARLAFSATSLRSQLSAGQIVPWIMTNAGANESSCRALVLWTGDKMDKMIVGCPPTSGASLDLRVAAERTPQDIPGRFQVPGVPDPVSWSGLSPERQAFVLLCRALLRQTGWQADTARSKAGAPTGSLWDHVDAVLKVDEDKLVVRLADIPPRTPPSRMTDTGLIDTRPPKYIQSSRTQVTRSHAWATAIGSVTMQVDFLQEKDGSRWFAQVYVDTRGSTVFTPPKGMTGKAKRLAVLHQELVWRAGLAPGFELVDKTTRK